MVESVRLCHSETSRIKERKQVELTVFEPNIVFRHAIGLSPPMVFIKLSSKLQIKKDKNRAGWLVVTGIRTLGGGVPEWAEMSCVRGGMNQKNVSREEQNKVTNVREPSEQLE